MSTNAQSLNSRILFFLVLILQGITLWAVYARSVSLVSLFCWLGSLLFAWVLLRPNNMMSQTRYIEAKDIAILSVCGVLGLIILWFFGHIPTHYHQDEFITAFTSWSLPHVQTIDWFTGYPQIWVSKFPILFHILQKPFFLLLGPSVESVRISVFPYYLGIIVYLYLFAKLIRSRTLAILTVFLYTVFAPNVYLSSMGLHFISSTFLYIATMFHFTAYVRSKKLIHVLFAALFCACAYLTYTSSYVTLPVLIVVGTIAVIYTRSLTLLRGYLRGICLFVIILSPFIAHAFFVQNYFADRIGQVNIFWGSWSDPAKNHIAPADTVKLQTLHAVQSLVLPNIGGLGGYNFGKLSLMDPLSGLLFFIGCAVVFYQIMKKRNMEACFIASMFLIPFITGFVLTTHPPPFHRISVIYPFFALIIAYPLAIQIQHKFSATILSCMLLLLALTNLQHVKDMIKADQTVYPQNSQVIGQYITQYVPQKTPVIIAAYPSFYLGQELLFRTNNRYPISTITKEDLHLGYPNEFLVLLNPDQTLRSRLLADNPNYRFYKTIKNVSLGDVEVFYRR